MSPQDPTGARMESQPGTVGSPAPSGCWRRGCTTVLAVAAVVLGAASTVVLLDRKRTEAARERAAPMTADGEFLNCTVGPGARYLAASGYGSDLHFYDTATGAPVVVLPWPTTG